MPKIISVLTLSAIGVLTPIAATAATVVTPRATHAVAHVSGSCTNTGGLVNGSFETLNSSSIAVPTTAFGWKTTATDNKVETWNSNPAGVPAYDGSHFLEMNANMAANIYQDISTTPGQTLSVFFAHRGRNGIDTVKVYAASGNSAGSTTNATLLGTYADGNTAWGYYKMSYTVPAGQTSTEIIFQSFAWVGPASYGNFLDAVSVQNCTGSATAPVAPTAVSAALATGSATSANVSWQNPTSDGGSSITGYTVTANPGGATCTAAGNANTCTVTGLSLNTSYTFSVVATNSVGNSPASSASAALTTPTAPGSPTGVTFTPGSGTRFSGTISWTAPSSTGGSAITGYSVTSSPSGKTCTAAGTATSCNVSSLARGTTYTFSVVATNVAGSSSAASASPFTTTSAPGAPTGVSATTGNGTATVSWTAPSFNGNDAITSYTATSTPGGKTCSSGNTSCTITGLTKGTAYTFTVTATNATGTSSASGASDSRTTFDVPGSPTGVSASTSSPNTSVAVSWSAPISSGGSTITGYTVTASPGGKTCTTNGATTCTISGLSKGATYTYTVTATNAIGTSAPSQGYSAASTSAPGAPTGASATFATNKVTVSWTAPTSTGNDPIIGYTVTASPGGKTCTTTGATTCSVLGLTIGTTYTFIVTATNSTGTGPASDPTSAVATYPAPGAATSVTATYANGAITVSWRAPSGNVTSYNVISNNTIVASGVTGTSTPITNFAYGSPYTFTVVAINAAGTGTASASSASVTPRDVPDAPGSASGTVSNGTVTLSWSAPTTHGSPITGYTVTLSPSGKTCTTPVYTLTCAIYGLSNGTTYSATIVALSAVGNSATSTVSNLTPITTPNAPTSPAASFANGSISISWTGVSSYQNGGSPITGYNVYTASGTKVCAAGVTTICTWSGFTYGTSYNFVIAATNAAGEGTRTGNTGAVLPITAPSAPQNASSTFGNQSVVVSWSAPASSGGTAIIRYTVTASPGGATCATDGTGTSCTIGGLTNGTSYSFSVVARNYSGLNSAAASAGSATPATTTWRPTGVTLTSNGNGNATVNWVAPGNFGGATPSSYLVTLSPGNNTFSVAYPATTYSLSGLTVGTTYSVTVAAINVAGTSPASASSNSITPSGPPAVPTILGTSAITVQPDYYGNYYGTMTVNLAAPNDWGFTSGSNLGNINLDIESPSGTLYNGSIPVTLNSDGTISYTNSFTFGPLPLYTTYTISASASNVNGSSASVSTQLSSTGPVIKAAAQGSYNAVTHTMTWGVIPSVNSDSINYVLMVNGKQICSGKASDVTRCAQTGVNLTLAPALTPQTPIASIPFNVTQSVAGVQTGSSNYVMNLYYLNCGSGQTHCSNLVGSYYRVDNGNLVNMDLSGLDLRGSGFYTSNLTNATMDDVNAVGAEFVGDNLTGLSAWGTDFSSSYWLSNNEANARFVNASWMAADNKGITGAPYALCATSSSITPDWTQYPASSDLANEAGSCFIYKGAFIASGVKIVNVDLSGLNVAGMNLSMSQFTGDNLSNASFSGTDLSNSTLQGDIVTGADFTNTTWFHTTATGLTGTASTVTSGYRVISGYLAGPNVIIAFSNLSGLDFSNLDLSGATFLNDDMRGANFMNDVFYQAFLGQVVLPGSGLTNPNLLTGANFTNADLSGVYGILASFSGQTTNSYLTVGGSSPARVPTWMHYSNGQLIVN